MTLTTTLLVTAALTFLLAGFVKGVIGLGLPTVAVGLLALVMTPAQAAAVLIVPSLVTNVWQLVTGPDFLQLARRLWPMMLGIVVGTFPGTWLLAGPDAALAGAGLGAALVIYGVSGLMGLRLPSPGTAEPWLGPLVGVVTGAITGATGVFVIPAVPYLQALELEKDELIQALGLSFTVSTIALAASLARVGAFHLGEAVLSLLALLPAIAGMLLGQWLRDRIAVRTFRICFFAGLVALGAHAVLRPLL